MAWTDIRHRYRKVFTTVVDDETQMMVFIGHPAVENRDHCPLLQDTSH